MSVRRIFRVLAAAALLGAGATASITLWIQWRYDRQVLTQADAVPAQIPVAIVFGAGIRPDGGLFLWVTLPERIDTAEMLKDAAARKVAFVPGAPFYVDGGGSNSFRMTFASVPAPVIREGIRILGEVIREHL